jgi:hypothetical protein
MAVAYHINDDEGLITVRAEGVVDPEALQAVGRAMLEDASFDPDLPQLLDFRGLQVVAKSTTLAEFRPFIEDEFREQVNGIIAVVIDEDLEASLCADIYQLTCAIPRAELFEKYDQALKWLMRREFVPRAPLLQQHNSAYDRCDDTPE